MQTKDDIIEKYATACNEILQLRRTLGHWQREAGYHMWRSKSRGWQIHLERQRFRYRLNLGGRPWWSRLFDRVSAPLYALRT